MLPDDYIESRGERYVKGDILGFLYESFREYLIASWLIDCGGIKSRKFTVLNDGDLVEHSIRSFPEPFTRVCSMVIGYTLVDETGIPVCSVLIAEDPQIVGNVTDSQKGI